MKCLKINKSMIWSRHDILKNHRRKLFIRWSTKGGVNIFIDSVVYCSSFYLFIRLLLRFPQENSHCYVRHLQLWTMVYRSSWLGILVNTLGCTENIRRSKLLGTERQTWHSLNILRKTVMNFSFNFSDQY